MTGVSRVGSIVGVLTLATGAILAGAVFGLTFVLEAWSRDPVFAELPAQ